MLADSGIGILYGTREAVQDLTHRQTGAYAVKDWANPDSEPKANIDAVEVGTHNASGIWALAAAAELINKIGIDNIEQRIFELTSHLCARLQEKGYIIFSPRSKKQKTSAIVMVSKPKWESQLAGASTLDDVTRLGHEFEKEMAGVKSEDGKKSIVFSVRGGRMRIGIHFYNTIEEIDEFVDRLPMLC